MTLQRMGVCMLKGVGPSTGLQISGDMQYSTTQLSHMPPNLHRARQGVDLGYLGVVAHDLQLASLELRMQLGDLHSILGPSQKLCWSIPQITRSTLHTPAQ